MSTRNTAVPRGTLVGPLVQFIVLALLTLAVSALFPAQVAGPRSSAVDFTVHAVNVNGHFGDPIVPCTTVTASGGHHSQGAGPGDHPWQDTGLTTSFNGDDLSPGVQPADHERQLRARPIIPQQPRGPPRLPCQH